LGGDDDRIRHQQRKRDQGLAAAEHHTLLGHIAASIGPRRGRSLIKIKETDGRALLRRKSSVAACIKPKLIDCGRSEA
jgi:hypothetical protein